MPTPAFIDSVHAAELLGVSQDIVFDLIAARKLRTYGGRATNPFLRSADVMALAPQYRAEQSAPQPKRVKSASTRVRQRLTADARWSDITEEDIRDWAARTDSAGKQAARKAASTTRERLELLLRVLDEIG